MVRRVRSSKRRWPSIAAPKHAIGCASGSDALLLVLLALGIGPGDEVIVPSFTFFATASAVWRLGAKPVFADIVPETFNLDPADVVYKITSDTKAIIPVHLFGQCAAMDEIQQIADAARGIPIIEDACQAIGAEYKGARAGSMGLASCFSFYPTKNLGGFGDGGLITTNDAELAAKLRVLCNHGMQPRYYHHFVGLNSRLDTLQAAVLNVKLPKLDEWCAARERHALRYATEFARLGVGDSIVAPTATKGCRHVWNQYTVRVKNGRRDALQKHLADQKDWLGDLLPGAAALAEVLCVAGLRTGQLAEDRAGLPRGAVAARVSGTDGGGAERSDRRRGRVLPRAQSRGSVMKSRAERQESRARESISGSCSKLSTLDLIFLLLLDLVRALGRHERDGEADD